MIENDDEMKIKLLYQAVLSCKNEEECSKLFEDLCTVSELRAMEQRLQVALLLDDGCVYSDILNKVKTSSATISRVNRCLHYGSGGYKQIIPKLNQLRETEEK